MHVVYRRASLCVVLGSETVVDGEYRRNTCRREPRGHGCYIPIGRLVLSVAAAVKVESRNPIKPPGQRLCQRRHTSRSPIGVSIGTRVAGASCPCHETGLLRGQFRELDAVTLPLVVQGSANVAAVLPGTDCARTSNLEGGSRGNGCNSAAASGLVAYHL